MLRPMHPLVMKLQQYGETNEGRPLLLAFISSAENITNLETIRKNNLRLANLGDKIKWQRLMKKMPRPLFG